MKKRGFLLSMRFFSIKRDYLMVTIIFLALGFLLSMGSLAFTAEAPKTAVPTAPVGLIPSSFKEFKIGDVKINFGANDRLRYEYRQDYYFGAAKPGNHDGLWYNRFRLNMNAAYQNLTAFVEGLDSRERESEKRPKSQEDEFDLHQGYLKLSKPGNLPVSLTVGRQELKYGAERLIAAPTWSNNIRSFDAVKFTYNPASFDIDFFVGNEVLYQDDKFNPARWGKYLYGVYATYKGIPGNVFDLYSINLTDKRHGITSVTDKNTTYKNSERYTVGTRGEGKIVSTNFDYGYEIAYQLGKRDAVTKGTEESQDIRAYAVHTDVNYTFKDVQYQPMIKLEYNYASGDDNPKDDTSKTFDPVYQSTHGPYGLIDFFRWQNMEEFALFLDFTPIKDRMKGSLQYHRYNLAETKDAWYNGGGTKLRYDKNGNASDYVGDEVDLVLNYKVSSFLNIEGGYARFFCGDYVKDTGSSDDADWFYLQTVITF